MKKIISAFLAALLIFSTISLMSVSAASDDITVIDNLDSYSHGWDGASSDVVNYREGRASLTATGSNITMQSKDYNIDLGEKLSSKGFFEAWLYIDDVSKLSSDSKIVLSQTNSITFNVRIGSMSLNNGWNKITQTLVLAPSNFTKLKNIKVVAKSTEGMITIKLDDICLSSTKKVSDNTAVKNALDRAKTFDTAGMSDHMLEKFNENIAYAESGVNTQHDADVVANMLNNTMDDITAKRNTGLYTDVITTHGRTYYKNNELCFNYSATGFSVRFYGTELKATMRAEGTSGTVNIYVDKDINQVEFDTDSNPNNYDAAREKYNRECTNMTFENGTGTYTLVSGLPEGIHTVTVLKRGEVCYTSHLALVGLDVGTGKLLTPPKKSSRTIEFIGDSNTTGYGNLTLGSSGYDPSTQDGTVTYAAYTAAALGAEYTITARSGCTLTRNDAACSEGYMTDTYLYTDYWNIGDSEVYDFASNPSDVVVIHLGDNDHDGRAGSLSTSQFVINAKAFVRQVRMVNPTSKIVVAFSITGYHDWRPYMAQVVNEINAEGDTNVYNYSFINFDQRAPSGHASMAIHKKCAQELSSFISSITGWDGQVKEVYGDPTVTNGSISTSESYAKENDTVTVTLTPDNGYALDDSSVKVISNGSVIPVTRVSNNVYTFKMTDGSAMITAKFNPATLTLAGDVNGDKNITTADALYVLQASVNKVDLTDSQFIIANVDGKENVTTLDALLILQRAVGKINTFPVGDYVAI